MPSGDIYRATIEATFGGEPVVMGLGFISQSGAADFLTDATQLNDELQVALDLGSSAGPFLSPLSAQLHINGVRIQDLNPGLSAGLLYSLGSVGGNVTDDALPPAVSFCVTWRDGQKGKAHRGRTYITGFAEDSQNAGYWISEIQDWAVSAFAQPLMDAFGPLGGGNYALALVHEMSGGVRIVPPTADPIISYSIHNETRVLRRRGIGVRISRRPSAP